MSQERYTELKEKVQSLGAGGFKKLSQEEQAEYQALKAEFATSAPKEESISVPRTLLEDLSKQIAELKANQSAIMGDRQPTAVLPGQAVPVDNKVKVLQKQFKRFRDSAENEWEYVADVKWMSFSFDRDTEEKYNMFKLTTITAKGDVKYREIKDFDFTRLGESVLLKVTDRETKEMEVQDRLTPIITTAISIQDSSNPKSVTGLDVTPVGPVKNMIRYKETSFVVHIPADKDAEGNEIVDTVNSPAKVTYKVIENQNAKGGVHLDPTSIKLL